MIDKTKRSSTKESPRVCSRCGSLKTTTIGKSLRRCDHCNHEGRFLRLSSQVDSPMKAGDRNIVTNSGSGCYQKKVVRYDG